MILFVTKYWKIILWILSVVGVLCWHTLHPDALQEGILSLQARGGETGPVILILYIGLLSILGLFFVPSTPFALLGVVIFGPTAAYIYNLIGILTSTTIVYWFAHAIQLDTALEERYPRQIASVKKALGGRDYWVMIGWSFFPFVPTDVIIYAASSLRIPYWKCLLSVLIGEGLLNLGYIAITVGVLSAWGIS